MRTRRMHQVAEAGVIALGDPHAAGAGLAEAAAAPAAAEGGAAPTPPSPAGSPGCWSGSAPRPTPTPSGPRCATTSPRTARSPSSPTHGADASGTIRLPAGASCVDAAYARARRGRARLRRRPGQRPARAARHQAARRRHPAPADGRHRHLRARPGLAGARHAPRPPGSRSPAGWPRTRRREGPAATGGRAAPRRPPPAARGRPADDARPPRATGRGRPTCRRAAVRLARCCTPVPPDGVTGFVIRGGTVAVHRTECPTAARMTAAGRAPGPRPLARRDDRSRAATAPPCWPRRSAGPGCWPTSPRRSPAQGIGIVSAAVEPPQEHRVRHTYTVELPDPQALPALMRAMRAVPGVYDVYRARSHRRRPATRD